MSGKAGVLFKATAAGNVYVSYGSTVTPPGTANFTLSAQANNQNSPNVKPQESTNYEVGSKWDFANGRLSLNTAIFRTENRNVIYTVDATAIPPIYNQDDSQRVSGVSVGSIGRITTAWEVFANFAYLDSVLDTQNDANRGRRLQLTPKYSASLWTTYRLPMRVTVGRRSARRRRRLHQCGQHDSVAGLSPRRWPGRIRGQQEPHAAVQPVQSDRPGLHPEHQQQRRPLHPRPAARGAPDLQRHVLGAAMLLYDSRGLTRDQVAAAREQLDQGGLGRWPRHGRPPVRPRQEQPAVAGGSPGGARPGRRDPRGTAAQSAVHLGGVAAADLSAAVQPATRAGNRSAATWTTPSGMSPARRSGFAPISRPRSSSAEPDEYDGGELAVEDTYGVHRVKLPAGHMVLYPSSSLHHVTPVTRGARIASFFWIQSMVRDDGSGRCCSISIRRSSA